MNKYRKRAQKLKHIVTKDVYGTIQVVKNENKITKYLMLEEEVPPASKAAGAYCKMIVNKVKK